MNAFTVFAGVAHCARRTGISEDRREKRKVGPDQRRAGM